MKYFFAICCTITSVCYSQTVSEKRIVEILYSPNTPEYIMGYEPIPSGTCGLGSSQWFERDSKKLDSLQVILNQENDALVRFRKKIVYLMQVYTDYSYHLIKEPLFSKDWHFDDTYGIRVLEEPTTNRNITKYFFN